MGWLTFGVVYTAVYFVVGLLLHEGTLVWFRFGALLIPPLIGIVAIARRRSEWSGCQWLFWAAIALGLATTAVGHLGWFVDGLLRHRDTSWLGWHAVFVLFGTAAPLLALLAQPHRGAREKEAATVALDIAGLAVVMGFLYSYLVMVQDLAARSTDTRAPALLLLAELQPFVVFVGVAVAAFFARADAWGATYRRLAGGLGLSVITLTLTNIGIAQGLYRPGFVYDFVWILPYMFYAWAAATAPSSDPLGPVEEVLGKNPSRPWLILAVLVLIPAIDYALRATIPSTELSGSRDLATAITVVSVLPLLIARLTAERSELRRADDRVRLLATAVDQAAEPIAIRTIDRRFVYANDAFCRLLGYARSELLESDAHSLFDGPSAELSDLVVEECRKGRPWRGTVTRRRSDGSTIQAEAAVVPFSDDTGRITHVLSVEHDVTIETLLREQVIHNERLSAVGQLVAGVAHELNNPLQSVIGFSELLLDGESRPGARADLEQVKTEAMRASRIVRHLLSFVRRSAGPRTVENLQNVVQSALALRRHDLRAANIALEEDYAEGLPLVSINRDEIQQVILNLIVNAEQAMSRQATGGRLRVHAGAVDGWVCVEVEDDGPGIPPELAGRIFEPFFSTKEVGEGTGLGLSLALGIASAHGGSLDLLSSDHGARFRLRLPRSAATIESIAALRVT